MVAKVGPVKAKFNGNVTLSNLNPPESYTISGEGKGGAAGFAKGGADVRLIEEGEVTVLTYVAKADVGGKLAQLGSRLIDGTARKMADEFFDNFARQVAPPRRRPKCRRSRCRHPSRRRRREPAAEQVRVGRRGDHRADDPRAAVPASLDFSQRVGAAGSLVAGRGWGSSSTRTVRESAGLLADFGAFRWPAGPGDGWYAGRSEDSGAMQVEIGEVVLGCCSLIRFSPRAQYTSSYRVRASIARAGREVTTKRGLAPLDSAWPWRRRAARGSSCPACAMRGRRSGAQGPSLAGAILYGLSASWPAAARQLRGLECLVPIRLS